MKKIRQNASNFNQELLDLYDLFAHGLIDRRLFMQRAAKYAVGGVSAVALLEMLSPNYAWARQVDPDDSGIQVGYQNYDSPNGHGEMRGYLARPKKDTGVLPAVLVIHENRGLNPYVEDVVRRVAKAGFVGFAPDGLTPAGGYPGNDDEGRKMQRELNKEKLSEDFVAAAKWLSDRDDTKAGIGAVGFCYGGGISNMLAVKLPKTVIAAAPYYGRQPAVEDVAKIEGAMLLHYAELDKRVNEGWPAYEAALKENKINYEAHIYPGANHGFHNDTTPRYDEAAASLSWERTIEFFKKHLG